jgi:hypothetical protein
LTAKSKECGSFTPIRGFHNGWLSGSIYCNAFCIHGVGCN